MVHVQIATEDLKTLHPGVTGLCFIIKVWLVTMIGLTNSLSTSNFSEMIKKRARIHDQGSKSTADLCNRSASIPYTENFFKNGNSPRSYIPMCNYRNGNFGELL